MRPSAKAARGVILAAIAALAVAAVVVAGRASKAEFGNPPDVSVLDEARASSGERLSGAEFEALRERYSRYESRLADGPLIHGNRVTLLKDGEQTYPAMLEAIDGARDHIHLETYIMLDDEIGHRFADALIARSRDGVDVRLIYDGFGGTGNEAFWQRLADGGVDILEYKPPEPAQGTDLADYGSRDHRKILVVDGDTAFTGGINIYEVYANEGGDASTAGRAAEDIPWRDTHVKIEGPAVAELQKLFVHRWQEQKGRIGEDGLYPAPRRMGRASVKILAGVGGNPNPSEAYAAYIDVIGRARERIWITQAYFAPNEEFMNMLRDAAQRGVDVKIILPGRSDIALIRHASRALYGGLLEAGVQIFEFQDAILHAKSAVVDGVWSTVGSSNLDFRSFLINDEVDAVVVDGPFAREMEAMFLTDLEQTRQITLETWQRRPLGQRLLELVASLFQPWI